jgi:hypothetical protein
MFPLNQGMHVAYFRSAYIHELVLYAENLTEKVCLAVCMAEATVFLNHKVVTEKTNESTFHMLPQTRIILQEFSVIFVNRNAILCRDSEFMY